MYTLAIDMSTRGVARDENGFASAGDLYQCNIKVGGELSKCLCNRSLSHLKLQDFEASLEDAESSVQADPMYEKGHLRILAAMEAIDEDKSFSVSSSSTSSTTSATTSTTTSNDVVSTEENIKRTSSNVNKLNVVLRGIEACGGSAKYLSMKLGRLQGLVKAEESNNLTTSLNNSTNSTTTTTTNTSTSPTSASSSPSLSPSKSILDATIKAANNIKDPRYLIACSDLGASYACGSYGLVKDVIQAERYLQIGSNGGDITAQRNLGLLFLELNK